MTDMCATPPALRKRVILIFCMVLGLTCTLGDGRGSPGTKPGPSLYHGGSGPPSKTYAKTV